MTLRLPYKDRHGRTIGPKMSYTDAPVEPKSCPYDIHLSIMFNLLSHEEKVLFGAMYDAVRAGRSTVPVPDGMTRENVEWLLDFFLNEAPELCAYHKGGCRIDSSSCGMTVTIGYRMPVAEQDRFISELEGLAGAFAGMSDRDGVAAIYRYLISEFDYDHDLDARWRAGTLFESDTQLAYYAMRRRTAVCNGYAQCFTALAHFAGYSCSYIDGHTREANTGGAARSGHAWNVAIVDGLYRWFDTTWDDGGSRPRYRYFSLSTEEMAVDHLADPEYTKLLGLRGVLPYGERFTMHLDLWNQDGFVRGIADYSQGRFRSGDLLPGEFFSPALVIWNSGPTGHEGVVAYRLDGTYRSFAISTVQPSSNLAYRPSLPQLHGSLGRHEITWYFNGMRLGTFVWTVE